jgi:hypothetical protein
MNKVDAGISLPFEVTYDLTTLFVAMQVFDCTSGTPVFVSTIPMTHTVNGTYVGFFTPAADKTYMINKGSYEDGTYTTLDPNRNTGSETFSTKSSDETAIAAAVWNTDLSIFSSPSTLAGYLLFTIPGAAGIAAAVWNALRVSYQLAGSFGQALQGILSVQRANNLDYLDAPISSISSAFTNPGDEVIGIVEEELEELVGYTEEYHA